MARVTVLGRAVGGFRRTVRSGALPGVRLHLALLIGTTHAGVADGGAVSLALPVAVAVHAALLRCRTFNARMRRPGQARNISPAVRACSHLSEKHQDRTRNVPHRKSAGRQHKCWVTRGSLFSHPHTAVLEKIKFVLLDAPPNKNLPPLGRALPTEAFFYYYQISRQCSDEHFAK